MTGVWRTAAARASARRRYAVRDSPTRSARWSIAASTSSAVNVRRGPRCPSRTAGARRSLRGTTPLAVPIRITVLLIRGSNLITQILHPTCLTPRRHKGVVGSGLTLASVWRTAKRLPTTWGPPPHGRSLHTSRSPHTHVSPAPKTSATTVLTATPPAAKKVGGGQRQTAGRVRRLRGQVEPPCVWSRLWSGWRGTSGGRGRSRRPRFRWSSGCHRLWCHRTV